MTVRLWIREDGEQPKAIARDAKKGPGPGRVVDVDARSANEARATLALFGAPEPNKKLDRAGWNDWDEARDRVKEVTS